jgi:hypothetical protein
MGTFAETAIVDNHLSFADQKKLPFSVTICIKQPKFSVSISVCRKRTEVAVFC